jgi:hypothetical protein
MRNKMTNLEILVNAKLGAMSAVFSDWAGAVQRDGFAYATLLGEQSEYTDEQVSELANKIWNGEVTKSELFG